MKPQGIIKTLINEIDPNDELDVTCNVGLAIVVGNKYHKLTLGDLRQCVTEQGDTPDCENPAVLEGVGYTVKYVGADTLRLTRSR